ncbi:hypothetical protein D3C81_1061090 [compost metagenome]
MRCHEVDTVGLTEISESIMAGNDLAVARWQRTEFGFGFGEQGVDLLQVGFAVAFVIGFVRGIRSDQCFGDIGDVQLGVRQIVPGMRVGNGFAVFIQRAWNHAVTGTDDRGFGLGTGDQTIQPWLETQAILDDQFGLQKGFGIVWRRLVSVSVSVRSNHVGDLDMFAADLMDHVGEDAEAGDHGQFFRGRQ